jgi:chlorite dismutase
MFGSGRRDTDTTALLMQLMAKVDDLAQDRMRRKDFESLERKFDSKFDSLENRAYTKNEVDLMVTASENDRDDIHAEIAKMKERSLSYTARIVTQVGGIVGIATGILVLWTYIHR